MLIMLRAVRSNCIITPLLGNLESPTLERVAAAQRQQIVNYVNSAPLTIADVSAATTAISASLFPAMEKEALIQALADSMVTTTAQKATKFQNWESMWEFMPEGVWESEGTPAFATNALQFLIGAGLRKPSEGTFRAMAVGFLLGGEDKGTAMAYDANQRQASLNMVKNWFRNEAGAFNNVVSLVYELPHKPQLLQRSLAEELYGEQAAPGKNRLANVDFQTMLSNTRCRKNKTPYLGNTQPAVTWQGIEALLSQLAIGQQTTTPPPALTGFRIRPHAIANVAASPVVPWSQHMSTPQRPASSTSSPSLPASTPQHLALLPHAALQAPATSPLQLVH